MKDFKSKSWKIVNGYIRKYIELYVPIIAVHMLVDYYGMHYSIYYQRRKVSKNGRQNEWINVNQNVTHIHEWFLNAKSCYIVSFNAIYKRMVTSMNIMKWEYFENMNQSIKFVTQNNYVERQFYYTKDKQLFGYGYNYENEILRYHLNFIKKPKLIDVNIFKSKLIHIACGHHHTLFLDDLGTVYGCGSNKHGQLGSTVVTSAAKLCDYTIINGFRDIQIIACGMYASYGIDMNNLLYSCGKDKFGVLGRMKSNPNDTSIECVGSEYLFKSISTGGYHVGCIGINNNELYMFGNNMSYQCGIDQIGSINKPTKLDIHKNDSIQSVRCGGLNTILKTFKGKFYHLGTKTFDNVFIDDANNKRIHRIKIGYLRYNLKNNGIIVDIVPVTSHKWYIIQQL